MISLQKSQKCYRIFVHRLYWRFTSVTETLYCKVAYALKIQGIYNFLRQMKHTCNMPGITFTIFFKLLHVYNYMNFYLVLISLWIFRSQSLKIPKNRTEYDFTQCISGNLIITLIFGHVLLIIFVLVEQIFSQNVKWSTYYAWDLLAKKIKLIFFSFVLFSLKKVDLVVMYKVLMNIQICSTLLS